jgi:hypothetical protein
MHRSYSSTGIASSIEAIRTFSWFRARCYSGNPGIGVFGSRVREYRTNRGISVSGAGWKTGCSKNRLLHPIDCSIR